MSVQTQIDRISGAVSDALAALTEKGVTVPAGTKVDDLASLIAAIEAGGGSPSGNYIPYNQQYTYTVDPIEGASNGFALNEDGYYESQNKGKKSSYALCRINLVVEVECDVSIYVINYAETNYDYGIFGSLDKALAKSTSADSGVKQSFKGQSSQSVVVLTYENVPVGNHFIDVKFIKDSGGDQNNDSVQFKVQDGMHVDSKYYPVIQALDGDLNEKNILSGVDIFGVTGTATAENFLKNTTGSITFASKTQTVTITHGLGKKPIYFLFSLNSVDFVATSIASSSTSEQTCASVLYFNGKAYVFYGFVSSSSRAVRKTITVSDVNEESFTIDLSLSDYSYGLYFNAAYHAWEAFG